MYEVVEILDGKIIALGGIAVSKKTAQKWATENNIMSDATIEHCYGIAKASKTAITWRDYLKECKENTRK